MDSGETTARASVDLDATDEYPVLDPAAYEAEALSLQALQHAHEPLTAEREGAARELFALKTRLRDSEARERNAQLALEAQKRAHAELTQRVQSETSARDRLTAEVSALQAQLANCIESLHRRESYRAISAGTFEDLDAELTAARLRVTEQEARANQLGAELQSRERRLQDAIRERDEGERRGSALESRLAEVTAEHADARAQLLAMQATLAAAMHRAETEALASGTAAERQRELESAIEEREAAASTLAANHAEQTALMTTFRGQVADLTARLTTSEAERRALEERVAAFTKEAADRYLRLKRLESMNAELRETVGRLNTSLAERGADPQRGHGNRRNEHPRPPAGAIEHR